MLVLGWGRRLFMAAAPISCRTGVVAVVVVRSGGVAAAGTR